MASKPKPSPSLLPPPAPLLRHHEETLRGPMGQWLAHKRIPPVLLVTGPAGIGKRSMVHHVSQWILCENKAELSPCGSCGSCRRALKGNWVDFTEISAEGSETLKIEQFRKLKSTLGFGAFDGAYKITFIRDADHMTVQAANSLLKILEEPPPGWIFLLTASDPSLLLPTLISRCQCLRLKPLPNPVVEELLSLEGVSGEKRKLCAELSQGSWSRALALTEDEIWSRRESIVRFVDSPQSELASLVDWASQDPTHLDFLLDQLETITRDLLKMSITVPDERGIWLGLAERVSQARQRSTAPLNRKLLTQDVLLPWTELNDRHRASWKKIRQRSLVGV